MDGTSNFKASSGNRPKAPSKSPAALDQDRRLANIDAFELHGHASPSPQQRVVITLTADLMRGAVVTGANMNESLSKMDPRDADSRKRVGQNIRQHLQLARQAERFMQLDLRFKEVRLKQQVVAQQFANYSTPAVLMKLTETPFTADPSSPDPLLAGGANGSDFLANTSASDTYVFDKENEESNTTNEIEEASREG